MVTHNNFLSLKLTFFLSLSLTSSSSSFAHSLKPKPNTTPPKPKAATASDLLALLGPQSQSSSVNPLIAQQLSSCLKFLVPFHNLTTTARSSQSNSRRILRGSKVDEENELIWWPPLPVLELARISVDSGADPDAITRTLDPTIIPVPDVEGSKEWKCELTRTPYGRNFISEEVNLYLKFLFQLIVARGPSVGLNISLNRYDFFHGHIFLATDTGRLGILFHAKEYPSYDKDVFPYNMGYCQTGSNVAYDDSMNLRNILWLAPLPSSSSKTWLAPGVLVVLDAHPGGVIYRDLVPEYVNFVRTLYEDDFGNVVADVNYLNVGKAVAEFKIFIC